MCLSIMVADVRYDSSGHASNLADTTQVVHHQLERTLRGAYNFKITASKIEPKQLQDNCGHL